MKHLIAFISLSLCLSTIAQVYTDTAHFEDGKSIPFFFEDLHATPPRFNTIISPFVVQAGPNLTNIGGKIGQFVRLTDKFIIDSRIFMAYFDDEYYLSEDIRHLPYTEVSGSLMYRIMYEDKKKKVKTTLGTGVTTSGSLTVYNAKAMGLQRFSAYVTGGVNIHRYPEMYEVDDYPERIYYTSITPISVQAGLAVERIVYYLTGSTSVSPTYQYSRIRSFIMFGYCPVTKFSLVRYEEDGFSSDGTYTRVPSSPDYDLPVFGGFTWRIGTEVKPGWSGHNGILYGLDVGTRPYFLENDMNPLFRGLSVNVTIGGEFGTRVKKTKKDGENKFD